MRWLSRLVLDLGQDSLSRYLAGTFASIGRRASPRLQAGHSRLYMHMTCSHNAAVLLFACTAHQLR